MGLFKLVSHYIVSLSFWRGVPQDDLAHALVGGGGRRFGIQ